MAGAYKTLTPLALTAALALLSACDNGPSAVAKRNDAASAPAQTLSSAPEIAQVDHRDDPAPKLDGKPMWSASRKFSAEENAQRAFERNGEDFGARSMDDFVRKAHDFVSHPPSGTARLVRANGDVLLYDPKGNVFAVANKLGAPRTMFKPDDGKTYWDEQKAKEAQRQNARKDGGKDDAAG